MSESQGNENEAPAQAAPASLADTTVLPRFPGYRLMEIGEKISNDDRVSPYGTNILNQSIAVGEYIDQADYGHYFRPIDPAPHTAPKCRACGDSRLISGQNPDGGQISMACWYCAPKAPARESDYDSEGKYNPSRVQAPEGTGPAAPAETEYEGYPGIAHDLESLRTSHAALLAAAKLAIKQSADLVGDTFLSSEVHTALNEAIEEAGGWTEAEQAELDAVALGANVPDTDPEEEMRAPFEIDRDLMLQRESDEALDREEGARDAALRAEEEAIASDPEEP